MSLEPIANFVYYYDYPEHNMIRLLWTGCDFLTMVCTDFVYLRILPLSLPVSMFVCKYTNKLFLAVINLVSEHLVQGDLSNMKTIYLTMSALGNIRLLLIVAIFVVDDFLITPCNRAIKIRTTSNLKTASVIQAVFIFDSVSPTVPQRVPLFTHERVKGPVLTYIHHHSEAGQVV